jgi:hypothetical protein
MKPSVSLEQQGCEGTPTRSFFWTCLKEGFTDES